MMKLERIESEIEKTKEAISKQQARLKELEAQKTEVENLQIVQMVRALRMSPAELSAFLNGKPSTGIAGSTATATKPAETGTGNNFYKKQEDTDND